MERVIAGAERWGGLCARVGPGGDADSLFVILESLYAHPPRSYHNLDHVGACLTLLDASRSLAREPDEVELAIWMHDCVYVPGRDDNERRSADIALVFCGELRVPTAAAGRVESLVMATLHVSQSLAGDEALIADIDLATLASPREEFEAVGRAIRVEYAHVPEPDFRRGRAAFFRKMLERPRIYFSPLGERFEAEARRNLEAEIAKLESSEA